MRPLSIAALQLAPVAGDPGATFERFVTLAANAKRDIGHLQLVVLPELHLSALPGPLEDSPAGTERVAVEIPGPLTERLEELAAELDLWIVAGSVYEVGENGKIHNTALAVSPTRGLAASYRKVFPWQPGETTAPGDRFVVFDIDGVGRAGLSICYDGTFPEAFRQLAWMGAEIIFQPTQTTTSDRGAEVILARANAIVNQLYVVGVNAAAPTGLGRSLIVDPEGMVKVEAGSTPEVLTDVVDLDAVTRVREFGTAAVSRMWEQIDSGAASNLDLPMYGSKGIRPRMPD